MKKVKILLSSALAFTSVVTVGVQSTYTRAYASEISEDSETSSVESNPITADIPLYFGHGYGYNCKWTYEVKDKSVAKMISNGENSSYYGEIYSSNSNMFMLKFAGIKEGKTEVVLNLVDSAGDVFQTITYVVEVDSELNAKFYKEEPRTDILTEDDYRDKYEWTYKVKDNTIADIVTDPEIEDKEENKCYEIWNAKGLKEGETEIRFEYRDDSTYKHRIAKIKTYIVKVDAQLNVKVFEKIDNYASVCLYGNCTTGYEWQYDISDKSIAKVAGEDFIADDTTGTLCGSGEVHQWKIEGLQSGETEITFKYLRPWDPDSQIQEVTYVIKVDENLAVKVSPKGPSNRADIQLESNTSTGYEWQYQVKDNTIADVTDKKYTADDITGTTPGVGGIDIWTLTGFKPGETEIKFSYVHYWQDKHESAKELTYVIKVDDDLNVTISQKSPIRAGFYLEGNPFTGYDWQYEIEDNSVVDIEDQYHDIDVNNASYSWHFKGLKKGETKITFKYLRPWIGESIKTKEYKLYVDEDLNIDYISEE